MFWFYFQQVYSSDPVIHSPNLEYLLFSPDLLFRAGAPSSQLLIAHSLLVSALGRSSLRQRLRSLPGASHSQDWLMHCSKVWAPLLPLEEILKAHLSSRIRDCLRIVWGLSYNHSKDQFLLLTHPFGVSLEVYPKNFCMQFSAPDLFAGNPT